MPAKNNKFTIVDEAIVAAALACNVNFSSNHSVQLRLLDSNQLCQLFRHCALKSLDDFILQNKLTGIVLVNPDLIFWVNKHLYFLFIVGLHLLAAIDSIDDLTDLGLDKITAKLVVNCIAVWKERGLPPDFHLTDSATPKSPPFTEAPVKAENPQDAAFPLKLTRKRKFSDVSKDVDNDVEKTQDDRQDDGISDENHLDGDFTAARWVDAALRRIASLLLLKRAITLLKLI